MSTARTTRIAFWQTDADVLDCALGAARWHDEHGTCPEGRVTGLFLDVDAPLPPGETVELPGYEITFLVGSEPTGARLRTGLFSQVGVFHVDRLATALRRRLHQDATRRVWKPCPPDCWQCNDEERGHPHPHESQL